MTLTAERKKELFAQLETKISEKSLLDHKFYQLWNEGKLTKEVLAKYAVQYYAHVRAFPTYISAVHANCPELEVRKILLENLMEEEMGDGNYGDHPGLWVDFAESLGVSPEETKGVEPLAKTEESVNILRDLTRNQPYISGVAALYAYESQVPEVAKTKREGLQKFYGIEDDKSVAFFTVHEEADLIHREMEEKIIMDNCDTEEEFQAAIDAAGKAAEALWLFLDGVTEAYLN